MVASTGVATSAVIARGAVFGPLLDGTTDWPAVLEAFARVGYKDYLTFEYFHPFAHYPEALIYQTSDALDRILGRKK